MNVIRKYVHYVVAVIMFLAGLAAAIASVRYIVVDAKVSTLSITLVGASFPGQAVSGAVHQITKRAAASVQARVGCGNCPEPLVKIRSVLVRTDGYLHQRRQETGKYACALCLGQLSMLC